MIKDITVCLVYFRSLTLKNLEASLYSVAMQDMERVESIVILDNNTSDGWKDVINVVDAQPFAVKTEVVSDKHGDSSRTHSWSTNTAVRLVRTPWVFFTRADYLLETNTLQKFLMVIDTKPMNWDGFVTANGCYLPITIQECEQGEWRNYGLQKFGGVHYDYTSIDSGVWLGRKDSFARVGGLDERLTAWGHAQTHFQWKLYKAGVESVRIPEVLFYHTAHGGEKDLSIAHLQLSSIGVDIREMWERYEGSKVY